MPGDLMIDTRANVSFPPNIRIIEVRSFHRCAHEERGRVNIGPHQANLKRLFNKNEKMLMPN
jgi:hypothetical protein